jgi:hypothetical protein
MKTADKILLYISKHRPRMSKVKISEELSISRPTLDKKLAMNDFSPNENTILIDLGVLD